jgi:hypothetical protein
MASLTRPLEAMRARFPYKLIDPYTIERTHNRNGRISVDTEQVSKDCKTMTVKQANAVRIYDKKFNVTAADR